MLLCLLARYAECFYASVITLCSDKLSVTMLNVVMLSVFVIMPSVAKLSSVMQSVLMLKCSCA